MGYQILISMLEVSNEYHNDRWLAYDRRFRQQAASQPGCKWSSIETTLWNWAFTSQARASRCKHCFSLFHQSKDCEFSPNPTSSLHDRPPYQALGRRRFLCRQWTDEQYAEVVSRSQTAIFSFIFGREKQGLVLLTATFCSDFHPKSGER